VALRAEVPARGINAVWNGRKLRDLSKDVIAIARDGLTARNRRSAAGQNEAIYLDPLTEIAEGGPTQAEYWLERFHGVWGGDVSRIFKEAAI
jgi:glutamate--cysteine ligase